MTWLLIGYDYIIILICFVIICSEVLFEKYDRDRDTSIQLYELVNCSVPSY